MATDNHGKQPIRTLTSGDVEVGVLNSSNTRVNVATESTLSTLSNTATNAVSYLANAATEATLSNVATEATLSNVATEATLANVATENTLANVESILTQISIELGAGGTQLASYAPDDIGGGGTTSHTWTNTTGNVVALKNVLCASTAAAKYDIKVAGNTYWTALTSESSPTVTVDCRGYNVASGAAVVVAKKNLENAVTAITVYTTINVTY